MVGHQESGEGFQEPLHGHHIVGENGLVRCGVSESGVMGKDVMDICRATAPMTQNKHGIMLQRFVGQEFPVPAFLQGDKDAQQPAHTFGKGIFYAFVGCHIAAADYGPESFPVCAYQGIGR